MERVGATDFGLHVVFGGPMGGGQAEELLAELRQKLPPPGGSFGVLVDARQAHSFPASTREVLKRCILLCLERGMERQAVVLDSAVSRLQIKRLSRETGTLAWTRYFDAGSQPDWEAPALAWLRQAVDPDLAGP
jgi:hypothetical protein